MTWYAKALALRAFVHPDIHLFYQMALGNINPYEQLYSKNEESSAVRVTGINECIAMNPDDFSLGLIYDVNENEKVDENTELKYTKLDGEELPPPVYMGDADKNFAPNKLDIPKNNNQPLEVLKNKIFTGS